MLNKLRSFLTLKKQPQQPQTNELILTDKEVKAVEYAHRCIFIQMITSGVIEETDTEFVFRDVKHVTPWIIGYLAGILDHYIRAIGIGEHARYEVHQFFINLHFSPELQKEVSIVYFLINTVMSGKDTNLFNQDYGKEYIAGAQAGFDTPSNAERDTPKLELYWYLSNDCTPR